MKTTIHHRWYTWIRLADWPRVRDNGLVPRFWSKGYYGSTYYTELYTSLSMLDEEVKRQITIDNTIYMELAVDVRPNMEIESAQKFDASTRRFQKHGEIFATFTTESKIQPGAMSIVDIVNTEVLLRNR